MKTGMLFKIVSIVMALCASASCCSQPENNDGIAIYRVKQNIPDLMRTETPECAYCLDPLPEDLFDEPLLTEAHITDFDFAGQQIFLNDAGKEIVNGLDIPLKGMPVALTLNGEILYGFWFWNLCSSFGCDRVFTWPEWDFKIEFGLPSTYAVGEDPRFNEKLKLYLEEWSGSNQTTL